MAAKTPKIYQKDGIEYGFRLGGIGRKWNFILPNKEQFITNCGGLEVAHKVANILSGSFARTQKVDGMARKNIHNLVNG